MPCRPIPLPRHWPGRMHTAIIHAISLAQFALTAARARPEKKQASGSRRERDIERLHQEVHLLREELRLKDTRMKRMPGHRQGLWSLVSPAQEQSAVRRG